MIAYIEGRLRWINENSVTIDVNGIGYEIVCPNPFAFQKHMDEILFIHTYFHVRDDAQVLYGFKNEDEKYLFTKLISVSGIGPKSAVAILATVNVNDFIAAIETEDEKYLTQFPGVGKKTARQIILDLKGKLTAHFSIFEQKHREDLPNNDAKLSEVTEALLALGYTDREVKQILPELKVVDTSQIDDLIKQALSLLVKI